MTLKDITQGCYFRTTIKLSDDVNILCDYRKGTRWAKDSREVFLTKVMVEISGIVVSHHKCGVGIQWMNETMPVTQL